MKWIPLFLSGVLILPPAFGAESPTPAGERPKGEQRPAAEKSPLPVARKSGVPAPKRGGLQPRTAARAGKAAGQSKPPVIDMGCVTTE